MKSLGLSPKKAMEYLRENRVFYSTPSNNNMPYSQYMDAGYFIVYDAHHSGGIVRTQTRVTNKGQDFLFRFFVRHGWIKGDISKTAGRAA